MMEEFQKYLREDRMDTKIASSVQKEIKEIVANDGNVHCANDRLNAFADTSTGKSILGLAQHLMKDLDLTFTEQVFLQESGYCPEGPKDEVKQEPLIKSLLDVYKELERPIIQTDGLADGSDGANCFDSPRTPKQRKSRFKRQLLKSFVQNEDQDNSWDTINDSQDFSAAITIPDVTFQGGISSNFSGIDPINWTATESQIDLSNPNNEWETFNDSSYSLACGMAEHPAVNNARIRRNRNNQPPNEIIVLDDSSIKRTPFNRHTQNTSKNLRVSPGADESLLFKEFSANLNRRSIAAPSARPKSRRGQNYNTGQMVISPSDKLSQFHIPSPPPRRDSRNKKFGETFTVSSNDQGSDGAWSGFDAENAANEQRFFELNDSQKTLIKEALKIPKVLPTVVQVGHSIILNAEIFVDERDTKQFTLGGLLLNRRESMGRSLDKSIQASTSANSTLNFNRSSTPKNATYAGTRTPGAPLRPNGRDGQGRRMNMSSNESVRRLNFSSSRDLSSGSHLGMNSSSPITPGVSCGLGNTNTPGAPMKRLQVRERGSGSGQRQLNYSGEEQENFIPHEETIWEDAQDITYSEDPFMTANGPIDLDASGRSIGIVGPRSHGFYPDESI